MSSLWSPRGTTSYSLAGEGGLGRRRLHGFPAEPGSYLRDFAAMYRFEDGKIAERWAIRDDLGMLQQLGAFGAHQG